jgi:transcriptional antiterminator RfaH
MPILAPEITIHPDDLLDTDFFAPSERRWWAVYTQSRQEKVIARRLLAREVPFYLPLVAKDNLIRGRRVRSHVPLFAGYVFLFGSDDERSAALSTNRVSGILPVADQSRLHEDLRQVRRLIAARAPLTVEDRLLPGQRVRVKGGALSGLEGVVLSRRGKARILVAVDFLQRGVSVAIEDFLLEPIDGDVRESSPRA